ncbi:CMGC/CDK/CDK8 protein kinase Srb10 [Schizosaccharomyces japonicus yFS275]|uniref:Cyclin-dependent kinase 8 n=1 Tax=Schizosaccharomyces japonicus (strain yFS275 / FY16936) TaxID=402676 RepID=B6JVD5_SCHJY|nr:CMGC/CDK/CDK8 protein kinase Srb10 [Schizosaccharomyces japonicus yFS275]EEB05336.2 CMGC/CDK/CDK8 protein kinase Srb10 [Schizosaccharomyces japonicus yFS275]
MEKKRYNILGFISAGTYGKVYKATAKDSKQPGIFAIKRFKPESKFSNGQNVTNGISQSAIREISLCRELHHENIVNLVDVMIDGTNISMVFEYAEYDLLQIIQFHLRPRPHPIPKSIIKSFTWQILNGIAYLHENWILHRDLKPANILITEEGVVKVGDLGLGRIFRDSLQSLYASDRVVVTIWYRAPELLLGARNYTPAIDMWAIGCVFAEILALGPLFKGEEMKMETKKVVPFQKNQMLRIMEVLGTPTEERWPGLSQYPEYHQLATYDVQYWNNLLPQWYHSVKANDPDGLDLLMKLLEYDPSKRISAKDALSHSFFTRDSNWNKVAFKDHEVRYPRRRISVESEEPSVKRSAAVPLYGLSKHTKL